MIWIDLADESIVVLIDKFFGELELGIGQELAEQRRRAAHKRQTRHKTGTM